MRIRSAVLAALVISIPAMVGAQAPAPDTLFARSPWGAEGEIGIIRASLLHARPSGTALVMSLSAYNSASKVTQPDPLSGGQRVARNGSGLVALQLGARHYSGRIAFRPYVEGGVSAQYGRSGPSHVWSGGIYGEIGAAYFVAPHVSVGVAQDLGLRYFLSRDGLLRGESWNASLDYPTVRLAVFF